MTSPVRQDVVAVWYDPEQHGLFTQFGEEKIYGLKQIARRLAADGWRITSTLPLSWTAPDQSSAAAGSRHLVTEIALFIAKDS
jgi:hypothetical protein